MRLRTFVIIEYKNFSYWPCRPLYLKRLKTEQRGELSKVKAGTFFAQLDGLVYVNGLLNYYKRVVVHEI